MENLLEQLAQNLKALREEQDLSQKVLSERSGLDRTYLGKIERGERVPSLETLEKVAAAVNVEPYELLRPLETSSSPSPDLRGRVGRLHDAFDQHQRHYFSRLSDMVDRETRSVDETGAKDVLDKIFTHLNAMSELYDQLLSHKLSEQSNRVKFSEFIESVLEQLEETLNPPGAEINLRYTVTPGVELYPDDAVACVLALQLTIDNAYKHAFDTPPQGMVEVDFSRQEKGRLKLVITDDGFGGISEEDFDGSLSGLNIVKQLVTYDLRGELSVDSDTDGTHVMITFTRENELEVAPEDVV